LRMNEAATMLRARLALVRRELGDPWPAMDEESLLESLETWLAPQLGARARALTGIDVAGGLRHLLPWPEAADLAHLAPERLAVPSGSTARIDYPDPAAEDGRPVVAVKLQEVFGLAETPRLVRGRVPVLFHLLSPARRPLAVTDGLRSFWDGPDQAGRRDVLGRLPKHHWPADAWTAPATARTSRGPGAAAGERGTARRTQRTSSPAWHHRAHAPALHALPHLPCAGPRGGGHLDPPAGRHVREVRAELHRAAGA